MASLGAQQSPALVCFLAACRNASRKAASRNVKYELTRENVLALWTRCKGKCEVSGIPFDVDGMDAPRMRRPWAPSLDRIASEGDYTPGNVRVVCIAVNLAMNQWGEAVLLKMASAMFYSGAFSRTMRADLVHFALPENVRPYRGKRGLRYLARVREAGAKEKTHLGVYPSIEAALKAQEEWAVANSSPKTLRSIFNFTQNPDLLSKINELERV